MSLIFIHMLFNSAVTFKYVDRLSWPLVCMSQHCSFMSLDSFPQ